jgi:hypothetical protein
VPGRAPATRETRSAQHQHHEQGLRATPHRRFAAS